MMKIVALVVFSSAVLLIIQSQISQSVYMTEALAFGVSVAALALAVLAGLHNSTEARALKRVSLDLKNAISELHEINTDNESIKRRLEKDYALDQQIAEALSELQIGDDDTHRGALAKQIHKKLKKRG